LSHKRPLRLIFVGAVVPDTPTYVGAAFNRAGNLLQVNVLRAIRDAGVPQVLVLSQRPVRLFPRSKFLFQRGEWVTVGDDIRVWLVPFLNLPILRQLTVGLTVGASIAREAWKHRHQRVVVCTLNLSEPPGLFTWLAARLAGARLTAYITDINVPGHLVPNTWPRRAIFWLQQRLLPRFDALIVVSERIAQDFAPGVPAVRVEGGVTAGMLNLGRDRLSVPPAKGSPFTVVAAGSLDAYNGIQEMVDAMAHIDGNGYRLRIAGAGPLAHVVQAAAQRDPRIEFCGYLRFDQVLDLYASADAVVNMRITGRLNTLYCFPSKMMECLVTGIPLITTCPAHVREEFSEFVYMLEEESPQALARKVAEVAALPAADLRARAQAAWRFMTAERTWERQGHRIVSFLQDALR